MFRSLKVHKLVEYSSKKSDTKVVITVNQYLWALPCLTWYRGVAFVLSEQGVDGKNEVNHLLLREAWREMHKEFVGNRRW